MSLARRSVSSAYWNIFASFAQLFVSLGRFVILNRWLPVDTFGAYALASSIVRLTVVFPNWGMSSAFLYRAEETENQEEATAVQFTVKLLNTLTWAAVHIIVALLMLDGPTRTALIVLTIALGGQQLTQTPRLVLMRRVEQRRIALVNALNAPLTAAAAIFLAWQGATMRALLATDLTSLALSLVMFYGWRPVWRPRLAWSRPIVRYYITFGSRAVLADLLQRSLDRVDDLWTGFFLGDTAMGFYSRAYTFATYPRQILAAPINTVSGGTYAELKDDPHRLSQAFFRTNAFLVRTGFLLAGGFALVAPEAIRILVTAKWLPMLDAFRLMLIFTLLDPLKATIANLFIAVGKPEKIVRARVVQLVILIVGLFILGPSYGITGVAPAVDIMLIVGIGLLLWQARAYASFSIRQMFVAPGIALAVSLLLARAAILFPGVLGSPWRTGSVKGIVFLVVYGTVLLLLERKQTMKMVAIFRRLLLKKES